MREPLPLACLSGAAYARAAAAGKDAREAARRQWESGFRFAGEDRQREHEIAFGGVLAFDELLASPPREDERGDGWDERETTRFGRCARRLWDGLATYERVTER
jgi:exonuclease V gamma subunit